MMGAFSVYRRLLCACSIFWVISLLIVYLYFNDASRMSTRQSKLRNLLKLGSSQPDRKLVDGDRLRYNHERGRGVFVMTNHATHHTNASLVLDIASPRMLRKHARLAEYCNLPNKEMNGAEGKPMVDPDNELLSVYVITRHGDRSVVGKSALKGDSEIQLPCAMNKLILANQEKLSRYESTMKAQANQQNSGSRFMNWALYPTMAICRGGDLTGMGVLQHIVLGDYLQKRYFNSLFPLGAHNEKDLLLKSTATVRTYQSAIAFLYGFLPSFRLSDLNIQRVRMNICGADTPETPCSCPASFKYQVAYEQFAATHNRLDKDYQHLARHVADIYAIATSHVPIHMWTLLDPFMVHACHDLPIKCNKAGRCVDGRLLESLWRVHDDRSWAIKHPKKFAQKESTLTYYPLLKEIADHMAGFVDGTATGPRLSLYSSHDHTLTGVLLSLGAYDGKWSRYASRVVFEQYRHKASGTFHLRVLRDGQDITGQTTFCGNSRPRQLCAVDQFRKFVNTDMLNELFGETSYVNVCNTSS